MRPTATFILGLLAASAPLARAADPPPIRVGAKSFTEQHILGELISQLIERHTDLRVDRRFDLGGTGVCHAAMLAGELDIYVEYTGTALLDVLKEPVVTDAHEAYRRVARGYRDEFDLVWLPPIGFRNAYAITVRAAQADAAGWTRISDLVREAGSMTAGFTSEFIERPDGYPGLAAAYGIHFANALDLDPGLMYRALAEEQVDVICAFTTDSRIATYHLRTLDDDRKFFPPYDAAPVIRDEVLRRHPEIGDALMSLAGTINDEAMRTLNAAVDEQGRRPRNVAAEWIDEHDPRVEAAARPKVRRPARGAHGVFAFVSARRVELWRKVVEHLWLTGLAMGLAIGVGVPIGVLVYRVRSLAPVVLSMTEIVQTIPSLAMLAFLFAVYRVLGTAPAVTALFLYALLPIVLNTLTGLRGVAPETREAAAGIGMSSGQRLRLVELPLALPVIVAGVRTASVWTVGIATLSTYIGAGGLGDFINRGLARNDPALTMLGAVPAAMMAVVASLVIRVIERRLRRWQARGT